MKVIYDKLELERESIRKEKKQLEMARKELDNRDKTEPPPAYQSNANFKDNNCATCGEEINSKGIQAIGKKFHADCFKCNTCQKPLGTSFLHFEGKAYCVEDFQKMNEKVCNGCHKKIDGKYIKALSKTWHVENCFVCFKCRGSLADGFFEENGSPFCKNCIS